MTLKMMTYGKERLFALAMMTLILTLTLNLTLSVSAQTDFDCSAVTEIPTSECDALVALYNTGYNPLWMPGPWFGEWFGSNTPCSWTGITCEGGSIGILDIPMGLNSADPIGVLPAEIANLTKLRRLDLTGYPVTLSPEIGSLSNLTHLTLQRNGADSLPDEIGDLSKLAVIDLRYNEFTTFPTVLTTLPALTHLYISYNQLTDLPPEIGDLTTLQRVHLNQNQLTSIPSTFSNLTDLELLFLASNELTTLPESVLTLLHSNSMEDLTLDENPWAFSCGLSAFLSYTIIPLAECEALVAIYDSMGGASWTNRWGSGTSDWTREMGVCWWDGVECDYNREHVIHLNLPEGAAGAVPAEIGNLTHLTSLNVQGRAITSLPPEIGNMTALEWLYLGEAQLTTLPEEIGNLTKLRWLDVAYNNLSTLPATIGDLPSLTYLNLRGNQLTALPTTIGDLTTLEELLLGGTNVEESELYGGCIDFYSYGPNTECDYSAFFDDVYTYIYDNCDMYYYGTGDLECDSPESGNRLTMLPAEIGNLTNLRRLDLDHNQLTTLPLEIGNLPNLLSLYVSHNDLSEIPAEIGNITTLKRLILDDNELTAIPAEIGNLTATAQLDLSDNLLTTITADLTNMTMLNYLDLSNNQLTVVPTGFESLPSEALVNVSNNQLVSNFDCATVIQILQVECEALVAIFNSTDGYGWGNSFDDDYGYYNSGNYGSTGDEWFTTTTPCSWSGVTCTAARITNLNLSDYGLSGALPAELGDLTELTELIVSANGLTEVPAEIGDLTKLEHINLYSNQLTELPAEIGNLTALTQFGTGQNRLTMVPSEIGNLTNLESIWLSNNNLTTLPDTMGNLVNVQYLDLANNQLTTLPDGIGNMVYLDQLILSYNPITDWPATLTNLQSLSRLYLYGLCGPDDLDVNAWIEQYTKGLTRCSDVSVAGQLWIERDGIDGFGITDQPIMSATVRMESTGGQIITVTTDATGQYNFTTLPFTQYMLVVDTTTFTTTATQIIDPDGVLDNMTMVLLESWDSNVRNQNFGYFSCTAITDIPASECDALLAVYNGTGGQNWAFDAQDGWIETGTPCEWAGVICEDGHVTELQFGSAGLTGDMPPAIGAFTELIALSVWDNGLTSLPAELVDLTKLERLDIGRNPWQTFPTQITEMTNLLGLYISDSNLVGLPSDIGNLTNLEDLHVWENRLTELPEGIGNLTNMKRLILRGNLLQNLPYALTSMTDLVRLDVKYNNLGSIPAPLETVATLDTIDIQGNNILCSQVGDWTNVQGACVSTNDIPLAVGMSEMGGMVVDTSGTAIVLLFALFIMTAVTKQAVSRNVCFTK